MHSQKTLQNSYQLTKTEKNVLKLIMQKFPNTEIANQLNNSIKAIKTFRFEIMKKMGINKSKDMVQKAQEEGWISNRSSVFASNCYSIS
ncbi:response regulator transcription factor [Catalinimonas locisalis]|uniref:response regulator transcription factor n=1 Tax=Catalinimonas locisalis TaxID=3133978 RepID=UPI0031010438